MNPETIINSAAAKEAEPRCFYIIVENSPEKRVLKGLLILF